MRPEALAQFGCAHLTVQARIRRRQLTAHCGTPLLRDISQTAAALPLASR